MTHSETRERPGKEERLVASARELLHEQGVQCTTLAEIAGVAAEALGWDATRAHEELRTCAAALRERHGVRLQPVAANEPAPSAFDASLMASPVLGPT